MNCVTDIFGFLSTVIWMNKRISSVCRYSYGGDGSSFAPQESERELPILIDPVLRADLYCQHNDSSFHKIYIYIYMYRNIFRDRNLLSVSINLHYIMERPTFSIQLFTNFSFICLFLGVGCVTQILSFSAYIHESSQSVNLVSRSLKPNKFNFFLMKMPLVSCTLRFPYTTLTPLSLRIHKYTHSCTHTHTHKWK